MNKVPLSGGASPYRPPPGTVAEMTSTNVGVYLPVSYQIKSKPVAVRFAKLIKKTCSQVNT